MIKETNFVPLYDHNAKLFTLGYHVERDERDDILYDLMASEAQNSKLYCDCFRTNFRFTLESTW